MSKYLFQASYTDVGVQGLIKEGGTRRFETFTNTVRSLEGKVESFYFAFGDTDVFTIVDLPNNTDASAIALAISSTGAVKVKTTVLLTPDEVDRSVKKTVNYRAPGK